MKIKRGLSILLLAALLVLPLHALGEGALYQVSTLQALMQGDYYGAVPAGELLTYGDTGLGTFDALDGEMVVLDGVVYKAAYDGSITAVEAVERSPFANVAFISGADTVAGNFAGGYDGLLAVLSELVPDQNMPVVFRIEGSFSGVMVRSVPKQQEPYPPLTEVVAKQAVFTRDAAQGVIVGFRFPSYMADINVAGYHLHFLSDDRTFGGHLLDMASGEMTVQYNTLNEVNWTLPDSISLYDLTQTTEEDIEAVEQH